MKCILLYCVILFLLLTSFSCHSPTAPGQNNQPDTTSNNFTWQTFTFGASNAGSSHLQDVAIVSDSDIWCVGAVYLDSADGAPDPNAYNAIHWDGHNWQLKRIQFYTVCGQNRKTPYPAKTVYMINDTTIWIGMDGDQIAILNGEKQISIMCLPISFVMNKMWSDKDGSVYIVGDGGSILHYQNGSWQKIESGTTLDITDIWGSGNPPQILAVANKLGTNFQTSIIEITGNSAKLLPTTL